MTDDVLIWGAGAIGGILGAYLARAGVGVQMVDLEAEHARICSTDGLSIEGPVEQFRQVVPTVTPDQLTGTFRIIVLAVKPPRPKRQCWPCCRTSTRTGSFCPLRTG